MQHYTDYREKAITGKCGFSGHAVVLPGGDQVAFGMRNYEEGKLDIISIRDAVTLKEVQRYCSYGFDMHEIRLTPDAKYFVCGNYGSYLGHGVYSKYLAYSAYDSEGNYKKKSYDSSEITYPASVSFVEVKSGKKLKILSDIEPGQEGHADSDEDYNAYLANQRALLISKPNLENRDIFVDGIKTKSYGEEFSLNDHGAGICVLYDPKFKEVLVPSRDGAGVLVTKAAAKEAKMVEVFKNAKWQRKPSIHKTLYISGIAFHPDGKHYILSTFDGFLAVERGTHKTNESFSFQVPLLVHTHTHAFA